ncbi:MAG: glutathione S-transferase family protein [Betaproteobacteria bacterium]|nr:glutathione S-transferase family protein [Betaproteobacteria bacterium]
MIKLHELADAGGRHYSTFSWRTRLALAHKGLAWQSVPVKVSDKAAIAFSGQKKVPIITDGERVVYDSWKIAEYLEDTYPERPSLFGGETGRSLARFFNSYADRQLVGSLFPALMLENVGLLAADDAAHIRAGMEKPLGKTLEELAAGREQAQKAFSSALDPVRSVLRAQPYVSGAKPAYADYILFSVFQWARITTASPIAAADDPLWPWFDRLLDSFDSLGRNEPART